MESIIKLCEDHIEKLKKELSALYTIDRPDELNENLPERIDVEKYLKELEHYEDIYSVLADKGISDGAVYDEYMMYLNSVREAKTIIKQKKKEIEQEKAADIKNVKVLLESFQNKYREMQ
ncbi:hypothetical protein HXA35_20485 [Bacillus sp. A301a_S52]|jgi:hypothetical protein|nr:hypothetical protein [Bacillus sp. A301a_S52]